MPKDATLRADAIGAGVEVATGLLIIGAGGLGREVAEAAMAANDAAPRPCWHVLGFLDDDPSAAGLDGAPVLGSIETVKDFPAAKVVVCIGRPGANWLRKRVVQRMGLPPERYATIVHPGASLARSTVVGHGTVLLAGVVTTAAVRIGAHVVAMPQTVLTHDDVVGDFATFGSGARLAGRVSIGEGAYVGAGALVREHLTVGEWAVVGMGAVVLDHVPPREIWAGVPAARIGINEVPADIMASPVGDHGAGDPAPRSRPRRQGR